MFYWLNDDQIFVGVVELMESDGLVGMKNENF
jgi:hypothetical protein